MDKAIADETKARADAISGLSASLTSTINSKVSEVSTALSTHEESSAEKFSQISASFESVNSSITEWSQTMATADEALSTKIDQLTVTVNGNKTAIETTSKALTDFKGNVDASYSIKLATDSNGVKYAAGMSLGLTGDGTNFQSQCIFLVDRFMLMTAANGAYTSPFYVTNGAMYVKEAFIKDASIGTAKIADASITMAKIVNEIKSANYAPGSSGWRITKDGSSEFNNVVVRGEVHADSGTFTGTVRANRFIGDIVAMHVFPDSSKVPNTTYRVARFCYRFIDSTTEGTYKNVLFQARLTGLLSSSYINAFINGVKVLDAKKFGNEQSNGMFVCGRDSVTDQIVDVVVEIYTQPTTVDVTTIQLCCPTILIGRCNGTWDKWEESHD